MSDHPTLPEINLVCPDCAGILRGTGAYLKGGPVFRCGSCKRVFRWWLCVWRRVQGFELIEDRVPIQRGA